MGRCKLEHGLVFWPEPLVKSNGGKRLKRQAMPKCQQPPHTDTPGSGSVLVCIGDICIRICMLMLPLYKQNKQMSKYTRIGDCSTNLLLLLGIHATEVSFGYVCYCSDCFVLLLLLLLWKHLAWRYFRFLPLFPTLGAPITAIFNSVRVDFLRRIPRVVIFSYSLSSPSSLISLLFGEIDFCI